MIYSSVSITWNVKCFPEWKQFVKRQSEEAKGAFNRYKNNAMSNNEKRQKTKPERLQFHTIYCIPKLHLFKWSYLKSDSKLFCCIHISSSLWFRQWCELLALKECVYILLIYYKVRDFIITTVKNNSSTDAQI